MSCIRPFTSIAILNKYRLLHTYIIKTPLYWLYIYITMIFFIPQKAIFMEFNLHSSRTSSKECHRCKIEHSSVYFVMWQPCPIRYLFDITILTVWWSVRDVPSVLHPNMMVCYLSQTIHCTLVTFYENR